MSGVSSRNFTMSIKKHTFEGFILKDSYALMGLDKNVNVVFPACTKNKQFFWLFINLFKQSSLVESTTIILLKNRKIQSNLGRHLLWAELELCAPAVRASLQSSPVQHATASKITSQRPSLSLAETHRETSRALQRSRDCCRRKSYLQKWPA